MSGALSLTPRLRLVAAAHSPVAARKLWTALPLQADWARMLADSTTFGQVNLEASNAAARLQCTAEPWAAHLVASSAWVYGPGINLLALTDRWAFANIAREVGGERYEHLDIFDHLGGRLLHLSLTEESDWERFGSHVVSQWARRAAPATLISDIDLPPVLEDLKAHAGWTLAGTLSDEWFDTDHRNYSGIPVDPSLLAPFLETLCDQSCPLAVRLGNTGLLLQHEAAFFDCYQFDDNLRLRSSTARLEVESGRLAAARILEVPNSPSERWLRLYDDECHCVLVIGLGDSAGSDDASLWQCMLRALRE